MKVTATVAHDLIRTPRVMQVEARFDLPADAKLTRTFDLDLPDLDEPWTIGLIAGPSGAGKTTMAKAAYGDRLLMPTWDPDAALVDNFRDGITVADITGALNAVGLSTVPAWLRPYRTLSGGEQFRADVARVLVESPDGIAVVDEFTSTVDRQVAKVVSSATAKWIRRKPGRKLIAVGCHFDVVDWLQPDWVAEPATGTVTRRQVQPRPRIDMEIHRVDPGAWRVFRVHHYLSAEAPPGMTWYGGFIDGQCVVLGGVAHFPHPSPKAKLIRRMRRLVVLPDWQGLGVGTTFEEYVAERYCAMGYRFRSVTAHPGLIRHYLASPRWRCDLRPDGKLRASGKTASKQLKDHQNGTRQMLLYGFEFHPQGIA